MADEEEDAATMPPFASADDLQDFTKGAITSSDPRAEGALNGASTAIRRYCGWHISPSKTETVRIDGPGGRIFSLPTKYLTALPTIVEHHHSGDLTFVDDVDYEWSELGEVERLRTQQTFGHPTGIWTTRFRGLEPTMTHGHDAADITDLQQLVLAIVTRGLASPTGATMEAAGAMSVKWGLTAPGVAGGIILMQHEYATVDVYRI